MFIIVADISAGSLDVVITYSLDNYIVVKGIDQHGNAVDLHGYLLSESDVDYTNKNWSDPNNYKIGGNYATYRGIQIDNVENTKENIFLSGNDVPTGFYQFPVRKINGVRSFVAESTLSPSFNGKDRVYSLLNGKWIQQNYLSATEARNGKLDLSKVHVADVNENTNATQYYRKALKLKNDLENAGILDLQVKDIVEGNDMWSDTNKLAKYFGSDGDVYIFDEMRNNTSGKTGVGIEEPQSKFNQHRLSVIKYAIEKNLSSAINNFNLYSTSDTRFQMPKLKETDWDLIYNNICILSFMQGLNIGGRLYSGYTVVPNNNNKEVVADDSIQIVARKTSGGDPEIYEPTFKGFVDEASEYEILGAFSRNTLSMVATEDLATGKSYYYYRFWKDGVSTSNPSSSPINGVPNTLVWSSYNSVVTSKDNNSDYTIKRRININNL